MARTLITSYRTAIKPTVPVLKDSVVIPSNVREIVQICPVLSNGDNHGIRGFLSVNKENSNTTVLNNVKVTADKRHWNKKVINVHLAPEGSNLSFVLSVEGANTTRECSFMLLIKYIE